MELDVTIILGSVLVSAILVVYALRRSINAVRQGEERFQKIFRVIPVAVMITSVHDGKILDANDTYWRFTGLKPEETIGRTVLELGFWKSGVERQEFLQRLLTQRSLQDSQYDFLSVSGERRSTIAYYELTDLGSEPAILTMLYDVSEQRRAEQALQKSDERFRKVFQMSPVAIVVTTLEEGRLIDANEAYWELSGHDPESSIGRTTFELHAGLRPEVRAVFVRNLLDKKSIQDPSYDFVNSGGERLKTVAFFELIEVDGQPAILSMFHDLTEQSQAREALRLSEARLRAMLEAVPDMVLEMKRDGLIVQCIPSATKELAFEPENTVGRNIFQVLPEMAEQTVFAMERALDSGQLHAIEFKQVLNGETRTFEARLTPTGPDQALAMIRDVSLNKWSEAERENLIAELEQKNAELERFTYTVSHDLKSPLITIQGFLGYVREDARSGNMTRLDRDILRITGATERMQHLLADLLELSRVGRLKNKPEPIASNGLIAEVIELLHGRISSVNAQVEVAEGLPSIYGDRMRIFEVFQNLIDNAAKFMGDQPQPRIEIGVRGEQEGKPVFFVRDNGIGVAPEYHGQIFGLFNKLDVSLEGTGVGLALVKRIVEFHKGQIWVESEAGQGAAFFFTLPRAD